MECRGQDGGHRGNDVAREVLRAGLGRVPEIGSTECRRWGGGTGLGKCRGRGEGMGAEDGDTLAETVRSGATDSRAVECTKAAREWRLEGWGIGKALHDGPASSKGPHRQLTPTCP
jgi:hypothetical protein